VAGLKASHRCLQVGHNLGLSHDGQSFPEINFYEEYYRGQGHRSNPVSWGPIMGELVVGRCQLVYFATFQFRTCGLIVLHTYRLWLPQVHLAVV
jgi:hypothetical protein